MKNLAVVIASLSAALFIGASWAEAAPLALKYFQGRQYYVADLRGTCQAGETLRLIVGLHGGGQSALAFAAGTDFHERADCAVVAYPVGLDASWNAHTVPPRVPAEELGTDDLGFLTALVAYLRPLYSATGLYLTGISNGGRMAYALACHAGATAVAVVATNFTDSDCPAPGTPIPLKHIHGALDNLIPWGGAEDDPPPLEGIDRWRIANGCAATTQPATDGGVAYQGCVRPVEYRVLATVGHWWPTGWAYDATARALQFFGRF